MSNEQQRNEEQPHDDASGGETDGEDEMMEEDDYYDDEDDDDDYYSDDDSDAALDDLSETELEEMAAQTQRSLLMVQMQLAEQEQQQERYRQRQQQLLQQQQAAMATVNNNNQPNQNNVTTTTTINPQEKWRDFLAHLAKVKVLKIMDRDVAEMIVADDNNESTNTEQQQQAPEPQYEPMATIVEQLHAALERHTGLSHVILGGKFLSALGQARQGTLLETIWNRHGTKLTYLKLGSIDCDAKVLDLSRLLSVMQNDSNSSSGSANHNSQQPADMINLTEMELASFCIDNVQQITSLEAILNRSHKVKQVNLLGVQIAQDLKKMVPASKDSHLVDPLLRAAGRAPSLDEYRFSCTGTSPTPLVSASCLAETLSAKPKWWRLGLDGVGLQDEHCHVLAQAMTEETCKAGDLLSLTGNPGISDQGFHKLFQILFQKQRMGLVKVDDPQWQANFDLVRSMNNLHGRLGFFNSGSYTSRIHWIQWLERLSQISWEDDAHKTNYLWFTILERPDFVHA